MTTYSALAAQHIEAANLKPRERKHISPTKVHALTMGVFEQAGLGIFEMSQEDVVNLVYEQVKLVKGWLIAVANWFIMQAVIKLVAAAWKWLWEKLSEWVKDNKPVGGIYGVSARSAVMAELRTLFADARKVVGE